MKLEAELVGVGVARHETLEAEGRRDVQQQLAQRRGADRPDVASKVGVRGAAAAPGEQIARAPPHADAERFECLHHIPVEAVAQPRLGDLLDTRQLGVRMDGGLEGAAVGAHTRRERDLLPGLDDLVGVVGLLAELGE